MACNNLLRCSNQALNNTFLPILIKSNERNVLNHILTKLPLKRSYNYVPQKYYSTVFYLNEKKVKKCNLKPPNHRLLSALFLSTHDGKDAFQVVVTNPSAQSTEFSSNISNIGEVSKVITESGVNASSSTSNISDIATNLTNDLQNFVEVVEPSLASLGLGNNTPVGYIQIFLEYLHLNYHMPWWMAIAACTVVARILLLPILIRTQRNTIKMSNHMPQLQYLQAKFGESRRAGNTMEASRYATEILQFMKIHDISPLKSALLPMAQAPVFLSFFLALRAMAKAPVESMKEGGIWWVTDLTIPDPYYALPVVACGTLYIVLKIGAESGMKLDNMKLSKYFLQALPVIALPFCINFPAAVLFYWCTTNFCTLFIVSILKVPPVRKILKLPTAQPIDSKFVAPNKGFISGLKDALEDQKALAAVEDRRRIDDIRFQKAGTGPIPRTYSYDPTKVKLSKIAAAAKQANAVSAKEHKS